MNSRHYYDSLYVAYTGDSVNVPFYRRLSFHTNLIDWAIATPNASVEIDLSGKKRNQYSLLFTGKWNPATKNHTISPRWVYNVSSVKGELRRYWRTGNQEEVSLPAIERDTTLWGPFSKLSYLRRRYLSSRYVRHPRYWRAYYLGLYGAMNRFSICIDGDGKQGDAYSFGLSGGWTVPLYKHLDGSGWDIDFGVSAGVMMTEYDEYKYVRESACYEYIKTQPRSVMPMVQDVHISLVYRLRSIDNKALYGATRFKLREERRAEREAKRLAIIRWKQEQADSTLVFHDINEVIDAAKNQLALYPDSTQYYYEVLKAAVEYTEYDSKELRFDDKEWEFKREVLMRNLKYYMDVTNEMVPEELRTDRLEREKQRKKDELQKQKEDKIRAKEEQKQAKEEQKRQKKQKGEEPAENSVEEVAGEETPEQEETATEAAGEASQGEVTSEPAGETPQEEATVESAGEASQEEAATEPAEDEPQGAADAEEGGEE